MVRSNAEGLQRQWYTLPDLLCSGPPLSWMVTVARGDVSANFQTLSVTVARQTSEARRPRKGTWLSGQGTTLCDCLTGLVSSSEDAVPAGADNAASRYQDDPQDDLTLY